MYMTNIIRHPNPRLLRLFLTSWFVCEGDDRFSSTGTKSGVSILEVSIGQTMTVTGGRMDIEPTAESIRCRGTMRKGRKLPSSSVHIPFEASSGGGEGDIGRQSCEPFTSQCESSASRITFHRPRSGSDGKRLSSSDDRGFWAQNSMYSAERSGTFVLGLELVLHSSLARAANVGFHPWLGR